MITSLFNIISLKLKYQINCCLNLQLFYYLLASQQSHINHIYTFTKKKQRKLPIKNTYKKQNAFNFLFIFWWKSCKFICLYFGIQKINFILDKLSKFFYLRLYVFIYIVCSFKLQIYKFEPPAYMIQPHVTTRTGQKELLDISIVRKRLEELSFGLDFRYVNLDLVVSKVQSGIYDGIKTSQLDNLAAQTCAYMNIVHPHYSILAARVSIDNLRKQTKSSIKDVAQQLYQCKDKVGRPAPLLAENVYKVMTQNYQKIDEIIKFQRDFTYDFFGFKTLQRAYLLKVNGKIVQRPQHMLMRVAIGIHGSDLEKAFETYNLMSLKFFTHATPTLFNAGTPFSQMSSCFLLTMKQDSISGIYQTLTQCAKISKSAGGIGISISNIRSKQSYIRGTNGTSNGIIPMLKVFNDTARYVDQGGGKRKGSFAVYLQPWHADIFQFLDMKKNHGKEQNRARDLFYGLWIPDLFMKRVISDGDWTLMCPNECPGLPQVWGQKFQNLYTEYETSKKGRKTIKARQLWQAIIDSQIETGTPYMLYKDACNRKSNQQNLGTIKSSNLCTQIVEYTSSDEIAVCNLASISLPAFIGQDKQYNFQQLIKITRVITRNLNKIIDLNYYPVQQCRNSNLKHRPIGIGIQGMADVFQRLGMTFESQQASELNQKIFEAIYYGAVVQSIQIAKLQGAYSSFQGSPASKGELQFDLWNYKPHKLGVNWQQVKTNLLKFGMRNSLLIAPMPTASTSQILGNNQTFQPYTANVYTRRVLAGQFVCINKNLVQYLIEKDLWTAEIRNKLIAQNGSVQKIMDIPQQGRQLFKTVWQISQKSILKLALGRSPFIDQSQSLNIHLSEPTYAKMCSVHFYAWQQGLKTGMYYLRSRPAADPIKFTVDVEFLLKSAGEIIVKQQDKMKLSHRNNIENEDINELNTIKKKIKPNQEAPKACPMRRPGAADDQQCLACGS